MGSQFYPNRQRPWAREALSRPLKVGLNLDSWGPGELPVGVALNPNSWGPGEHSVS